MLLALGGAVIGIGNWYVHAKNLQTKADAGALAGGAAFEFPCVAGVDAIDQRIAATARTYAGPTATTPGGVNPQVGHVQSSKIHTGLNRTPLLRRRQLGRRQLEPQREPGHLQRGQPHAAQRQDHRGQLVPAGA